MHDIKTAPAIDDTQAIDEVIKAFFIQKIHKATAISPIYQELWSEINRLTHAGSKRFRSRLTVLSYRMFGGKDVAAIIPAAAALELLHLAMLIHDDIIDRDDIRYGVDNITGGYNKIYESLVSETTDRLHYAQSAALLAGDLLLSESYQLMAESKIDSSQILAIQKLLGTSIYEVIGGELLDTESVFRAFNEVSAETVAIYKTASYTCVLPLLVGAQLAGVSATEQKYIRKFGQNLGVAFQLRDDVIGVFGKEAETGKTTTGDIREGKHTYMIEQFYALANTQQRMEFEKYFAKSAITDEQTFRIRELLVESKALEATEKAVTIYESKARAALDNININPDSMKQLDLFITALTKRLK